jgi:hypothetical protein
MLQAEPLRSEAIDAMRSRAGELSGAALAAYIDAAVQDVRAERFRTGAAQGGFSALLSRLDRWLLTEEREHLDDPHFPEEDKLRIVRGLHLMNMLTLSYQRFLRALRPTLMRVAQREGRPARLLELAGGTGGFALALAKLAIREQVPVVVQGSDIVPAYVRHAQAEADRRRLPVSFQVIDATRMEGFEPGAFDVVFVAQSMHHFGPGMLGSMIAQAARVARYAFVGIDGYRSLSMLGIVTGPAVLSLHGPSLHDAWISARSFYSQPELRLIAQLAAPKARVSARRDFINTVLEVQFGARP